MASKALVTVAAELDPREPGQNICDQQSRSLALILFHICLFEINQVGLPPIIQAGRGHMPLAGGRRGKDLSCALCLDELAGLRLLDWVPSSLSDAAKPGDAGPPRVQPYLA
jgi:hypothetical protein